MTSLPPDPGPYGADTDDAISALIDGELAGFAADTGRDVNEVRETLEHWRGLEARKAKLERARTAMSAPVPLDDDMRAQLVSAALASVPTLVSVTPMTPRRRRTPIILSAAAAVLLVVVGVGVVRSMNPTSTRTAATQTTARESAPADATGPVVNTPATTAGAAPTTTTTAVPTTPTTKALNAPATTRVATPTTQAPQIVSGVGGARVSLGDITDLGAARQRIQARIDNAATQIAQPAEAAGPCTGAGLFPAGATIVLRAPATLEGTSVEVIAATSGSTTLVMVLQPNDCSVIRAFTL